MTDWPVVTDDDGTGLTGTIYNKALTDAMKAYIDDKDGVNGSIDLSAAAVAVAIKDNEAAAVDWKEGTTSYLKLVTTNDGEKVLFGKKIEVGGTAFLAADGAAIYVNCQSETVAGNGMWISLKSTITSGDLTGVRSRVYGNAASAGANVRGGYFEAKMAANGKKAAMLEGILGHADYSAGSITVSGDVRGFTAHISQGAGLNAANLYGGLISIQTRGTENITSDDVGLMIRNEAVGGNGRTMDSAIRIVDLNMGGGTKSFTYGIDLYGLEIGTADIYLSSGGLIGGASGHLQIDSSGNVALIRKLTVTRAAAAITGEEHLVSVDYSGICSTGDSMVGGNFAVTPTGNAATWVSGIFAKVTQGATKAVNGYFSGAEFECNVGAMPSNLSDFGVLVLNWNSAATSSINNVTHGAYMLLRDYGTQKIQSLMSFVDASMGTKNDSSIVTTIGDTGATHAVRFQIGTTYYWLLAMSTLPSTT